jgi:hypothetical protein
MIRVMKAMRVRWAGHVARIGNINIFKVSVVIYKGTTPLGGPADLCKGSTFIRMDVKGTGYEDAGCIHLDQGMDP